MSLEESKENVKGPEAAKVPEGPKTITLTAIFYPDTGEISINCPLMANPMLMRGFIAIVTDAIISLLARGSEEPKIKKPGGFLNGLRSMR